MSPLEYIILKEESVPSNPWFFLDTSSRTARYREAFARSVRYEEAQAAREAQVRSAAAAEAASRAAAKAVVYERNRLARLARLAEEQATAGPSQEERLPRRAERSHLNVSDDDWSVQDSIDLFYGLDDQDDWNQQEEVMLVGVSMDSGELYGDTETTVSSTDPEMTIGSSDQRDNDNEATRKALFMKECRTVVDEEFDRTDEESFFADSIEDLPLVISLYEPPELDLNDEVDGVEERAPTAPLHAAHGVQQEEITRQASVLQEEVAEANAIQQRRLEWDDDDVEPVGGEPIWCPVSSMDDNIWSLLNNTSDASSW